MLQPRPSVLRGKTEGRRCEIHGPCDPCAVWNGRGLPRLACYVEWLWLVLRRARGAAELVVVAAFERASSSGIAVVASLVSGRWHWVVGTCRLVFAFSYSGDRRVSDEK